MLQEDVREEVRRRSVAGRGEGGGLLQEDVREEVCCRRR
jgi:hypothetical protein